MKKIVFSFKFNHENNPLEYSSAVIYWYGILDRMGYDVLYYDYNNYNIEDLTKTIKDFKADYFIHVNYIVGVHTEFQQIRELCKVYLLSSDAYRFHDTNLKHWIPYVDGIINYEGIKEWYLRDGLPEEGFLKMRWGFNPNTMCTTPQPKSINVHHYGGLHGNRLYKINQLNQLGIEVQQDSFLTHDEIKTNIVKSNYSLCFSSNAINTRQELKGRIIEIPAYSVLLTEPAPELDTYYNEDEIIIFNSIEEAVEKINYYNSYPKEYKVLFEKGKKALWERNTAYHEWSKILPLIDSDFLFIDPIEIIKKYHSNYYLQ
jgi:hypothetical protein